MLLKSRYKPRRADDQICFSSNLQPFPPNAVLVLLQVGMGRNKTLYALEDGIVRYTKEVYVPPPRSSESREVICRLPKGAILYKTFISVIPTAEVGSFKLVTML